MSPKVEEVLSDFSLLEGPHWDSNNECLYLVDLLKQSIYKYVPSTKKLTSATLGQNVSIIIPIKGKKDQFLVTLDKSVASITWDGVSSTVSNITKLYEVDHEAPNVFNDGKCDPTGRLWAGTMGSPAKLLSSIPDGKGSLYSFQKNNVQKYRTEVGISNGIAFNEQLQKMYYNDSFRGTVDQYDWDQQGTLKNLKPIFTKEKHGISEGIFDGMTIDTDGNLWVAVFGESKVIKIDPRRPETLLESIELPANQVTSVAFGGTNLDELWVTSGTLPDVPVGPKGGSLFRITGINAKGFPADEAVL
ncbi:hypothetical protein JTB14_024216 [Gonioctena quinquepunctata]|nr:hypothetical protein JTB14_024216 [Gonioctena quinquepunctata]